MPLGGISKVAQFARIRSRNEKTHKEVTQQVGVARPIQPFAGLSASKATHHIRSSACRTPDRCPDSLTHANPCDCSHSTVRYPGGTLPVVIPQCSARFRSLWGRCVQLINLCSRRDM